MKLMQVSKRSALHGVKCKVCPRTAQEGQWVAYRRNSLADAPAYDSYFLMHVHCMQVLVERAGPDEDEMAFEKTRQRIVESGRLWVNTSN